MKVLAFGFNSSPFYFCKIIQVILGYICDKVIYINGYVDDFIIGAKDCEIETIKLL